MLQTWPMKNLCSCIFLWFRHLFPSSLILFFILFIFIRFRRRHQDHRLRGFCAELRVLSASRSLLRTPSTWKKKHWFCNLCGANNNADNNYSKWWCFNDYPFLSRKNDSRALDESTHLYKRVCPSVGPWVRRSVTRSFLNEPIMDENGRKWLGKQSK